MYDVVNNQSLLIFFRDSMLNILFVLLTCLNGLTTEHSTLQAQAECLQKNACNYSKIF